MFWAARSKVRAVSRYFLLTMSPPQSPSSKWMWAHSGCCELTRWGGEQNVTGREVRSSPCKAGKLRESNFRSPSPRRFKSQFRLEATYQQPFRLSQLPSARQPLHPNVIGPLIIGISRFPVLTIGDHTVLIEE